MFKKACFYSARLPSGCVHAAKHTHLIRESQHYFLTLLGYSSQLGMVSLFLEMAMNKSNNRCDYVCNKFFAKGEISDIKKLKELMFCENTELEPTQEKLFNQFNYGCESYVVDFNKIIPVPIELHIASCGNAASAQVMLEADPADLIVKSGVTPCTQDYLQKQLGMDDAAWKKLTVGEFLANYVMLQEVDESSHPKKFGVVLDFETGQKYADCFKKYKAPNFYGWCLSHWDTPYNACDTHVNLASFMADTTELLCKFDTFNYAPIPIYQALSEKFPNVTFRISYLACDETFAGLYIGKNGFHSHVEFEADDPCCQFRTVKLGRF